MTAGLDSVVLRGSALHHEPGRRPAVSLGELQRAWQVLKSGTFRSDTSSEAFGEGHGIDSAPTSGRTDRTAANWSAEKIGPMIPVVGCGGGSGATVLAVAMASVWPGPARVVEACSPPSSGLAAASAAEFGSDTSGWRLGTREGEYGTVSLERVGGSITTADQVPLPRDNAVETAFLDVGWELDHLLGTSTPNEPGSISHPRSSWLAGTLMGADHLVAVTVATIPGLRRLELTLDRAVNDADCDLDQVIVVVRGPARRRWPRGVESSAGRLTRDLVMADRVIEIPHDKNLAVTGLTTAPLPAALLATASRVVDRLAPSVFGRASRK